MPLRGDPVGKWDLGRFLVPEREAPFGVEEETVLSDRGGRAHSKARPAGAAAGKRRRLPLRSGALVGQVRDEDDRTMVAAHPFDVGHVVPPVPAKPTSCEHRLFRSAGDGSGESGRLQDLANALFNHAIVSLPVEIGRRDSGRKQSLREREPDSHRPIRDSDRDERARVGDFPGRFCDDRRDTFRVERLVELPAIVPLRDVLSCLGLGGVQQDRRSPTCLLDLAQQSLDDRHAYPPKPHSTHSNPQ